jgi:hypothetical protein
MQEALKILKGVVEDLEKTIPAVQEDALKNRKSYKLLRDQSLSGIAQLKKIRYEALQNFNKLWYAKHPKKAKPNA